MSEFPEDDPQPLPPGPAVTRDLFLEWRSPRLGNANPEIMSNPVWEWLVRSECSAYNANSHFDAPSPIDIGPGWCFRRFGQSSTLLSDGRVVLIAGEHEDYYDPDFYIYNDVVIRHPDDSIEILGYPHSVFPPTDSHSATLVGKSIVLVGNLGYPDQRQPGTTPIYLLDLESFAISPVESCGTPPGWLHRHEARLSDDGNSILITGGLIDRCQPNVSLVENIDEWQLHLADWRWERLTERYWPRWEIRRADGKGLHLFWYEQAICSRDFPRFVKITEGPTLEERLGTTPDLNLFAKLYQPALPHEAIADSLDEYGVQRIRIDAVIVRYVERHNCIQLTTEGELPAETTHTLVNNLRDNLEKLENHPCIAMPL